MNNAQQYMAFQWMALTRSGFGCQHLHSGQNCFQNISYKFINVVKGCSKFYLTLYITSFIFLKLKKIKDRKHFCKALIQYLKKYLKSLLFAGTAIGITTGYVCLSNYLSFGKPVFNGKLFIWGPMFSSLGIYCEHHSRRQEIVYFVFVRAARSAYVLLKKIGLPGLPYQQSLTFMILFGIMSYIFHEKPSLLKNSKYLQKIWREQD